MSPQSPDSAERGGHDAQNASGAPESLPRSGRLLRATLIGIVGVFLLGVVASFLVVPAIAKQQLVQLLESQTGGQAQVGKIRFNPFTLRAEVETFSLTEAGATEPSIAFDSLVVNARWLGFLRSDAELDALILRGPVIHAELDEQGELNLAHLFASEEEEELQAGDEEEGEPLALEIALLSIDGGRVRFRDQQRSPVFDLPIQPLNLTATDLSTAAGRQGAYDLKLTVGKATQLSWTGSIGIEPIASSGELSIQNFELGWVATYLAEQLQFDLASGGLDLRADYSLDTDEGLALAIEGAEFLLDSLSMVDPKTEKEFLALEKMSVGPIAAQIGELGLTSLSIEKVSGSGGRVGTVRAKDETIRLIELLTPAEPDKSAAAVANDSVVVAETIEAVQAGGEVIIGGDDAPSASAPEISIAEIGFQDFEIVFEDRVPTSPATLVLSELSVIAKDYHSRKGTPLSLEAESRSGKQGRLKIGGSLQLAPLSGELKVDIDKLALSDWAPYLEGVAQLDIQDGTLAAGLSVSIQDKAGAGAVSVGVQGRAQVDDLKTVDRSNSRKFVEWGSLKLEGLAYSPEELVLGEMALSNAMARVISDAKGRTNLDSIFASPSDSGGKPPKAEEGASGNPLKIRIDRIRLDNVGFAFADLAPNPNFTIDLAALSGTIEDLSSTEGSRAKVDLEGRIDDTAPIRVSGQIHPLGGDAYTDLKIQVSGISMPTFSPYSGRFAGFAIERGKLDLDLAYEVNAQKLRAENRIELHEFNFGKAVKSKDATQLPLRLAIEVLRKPNGDIQIDIPLRGDLADPSFNILELATKTFVNIITRIATTPFAIVGGLLPGQGDKISKVQFEAGSAALSAAETDDLAILAGILIEKPALKVEVRGRVDPAVDEAGVRAALGGNQDEIADADWRALARARAKAVHDALVARPGIDPERLFMVDVEVGAFASDGGQVATQLGLRVR